MTELNFPTIGDIVRSPHSKVKNSAGNDKYDLLECDGSAIDEDLYPILYNILPLSDWTYTGGVSSTFPGSSKSLHWDGTFWWISSSNIIRQYSSDWVSTGVIFTMPTGVITGITSIEDYLYVTAWYPTKSIRKIDKSTGTVVSEFDINSTMSTSITTDGIYLFVLNDDSLEIKKYSEQGVLLGSLGVTSSPNSSGISYSDGFFYISGRLYYPYVVKQSMDGVNSEVLFGYIPTQSDVTALALKDGSIWITGSSSNNATEFKQGMLKPSITSLGPQSTYKIVGDLT